MKFTEKQIKSLNENKFQELFRLVMLEAWARLITVPVSPPLKEVS